MDTYDAVYDAKGEFLAMGVTGIVELLSNGKVIKSPIPGDDEAICRNEMKTEAEVYKRLHAKFGAHQRFVEFIAFDEVTATLTLEYMSNGTLRKYLQSPDIVIEGEQRYQWALAAAEALTLLHSISVVHCDFSPKNMLLDSNLVLKVADFGCSSIDGNSSTGGGSVRFYPDASECPNWKARHDVFALGCTIYEIFAGKPPWCDVPSSRVEKMLYEGELPDLTTIGMPGEMQQVVRTCWAMDDMDASLIFDMIAGLKVDETEIDVRRQHGTARQYSEVLV